MNEAVQKSPGQFGCKHPENRKRKSCCCGGHNHSNAKKNLNHNSTRKRLWYRLASKLKHSMREVSTSE